jgi:nucleotide-binding universal stress UspA family protein
MFDVILMPTDGSETAARAYPVAIEMAKRFNAKVIAFCVQEPYPYAAMAEYSAVAPTEFFAAAEAAVKRALQGAVDALSAAGVTVESASLEAVHPWKAICEAAENHKAQLIVMASHGRSGVAALMLGSQAQKVLSHTKTPVLIVR